uniref:VRR-NUC domain containing protein n=1 Tax=uncultured Caudovirales phage TaxID=2100421 RepID=A0A6J5L2P3_9CAUD|nr:VRR-NUC domain containing protein [uncultured Caudovirales phage]
MPRGLVSEHGEQAALVRRLRKARLRFAAMVNGAHVTKKQAAKLVAEGLEKGAPDIVIFDPPPLVGGCVGTVVEMKREGAPDSDLRDEQRKFLQDLRDRGWWVIIGRGCMEAWDKLREAGYDV